MKTRDPSATRLYQNPKAILRHRLLAGLKQKDLAKAAGLSPNHLCNIEQGKRNAGVGALHRLAEALSCKPEDLMSKELTGS